MNKKTLMSIGLLLFIYIATTGISYKVFSTSLGPLATPVAPPKIDTSGKTSFDQSLPKTEPCPLNGQKYSRQQRQWWEKHRPLGVMIENHEEARPQSGISSADVVYEAVAEGGITRFLAIFYCQDPGQLGPVRSARTYFIDFLSEYGDYPLYAHVGGANAPGPADALGQLSNYGWTGYNDMNQFSIGFPVFWRDYDRLGHEVATEHTMYSTATKLWEYASSSRDLTNKDKDGNSWDDNFKEYSFKDDASSSDRPASQTIHLEFWDSMPNYFVDWKYDRATNLYKRNNGSKGGQPHLDKDSGNQLTTKNIVVVSMIESNAHDGYENNIHLLYKDKGTGKATIFMDGKQIKGSWKKADRESRMIITDDKGAEIKFDRGLIWFEVLPSDGVLKVQ